MSVVEIDAPCLIPGVNVVLFTSAHLSRNQGFDVVHTEVPMIGDTNRSRGFAIAEFSSVEEANRAVDHFNEREMDGRPLYAKIDER